jgi:dihydroorotase (multifunctional complex type)
VFDLAIHGKTFSGDLQELWTYVEKGVIACVSKKRVGSADETLELSADEMLLPAATDLHVHLRDWGHSHKETVESATKSALLGGVTTVADMPNTQPELTTPDLVRRRVQLIKSSSYVDFCLHCSLPREPKLLIEMKEAGAYALKFYPKDLYFFEEYAEYASKLGLKSVVHAEELALIGTAAEAKAELNAVKSLVRRIRKEWEVRFAHISTAGALRRILGAKLNSSKVTLEVAPHHVFVDRQSCVKRIGVASAVRPPLRSKRDVSELFFALVSNLIDFYATDHAPHTRDEKFCPNPSPGFPALEIAYPLLMTKVSDPAIACKVYCERPAEYLGIKKGFIKPGYDADMVVFRRFQQRIQGSNFVSKARITPFEGEYLGYSVKKVFIRGELACSSGLPQRVSVRHIK